MVMDRGEGNKTEVTGSDEVVRDWNRIIPEVAWDGLDVNIPSPGLVSRSQDGRDIDAHPDVVKFLRELYGPEVRVKLAGRFPNPDHSGISYEVSPGEEEENSSVLATLESINTALTLTPEYKGRWRKAYDAMLEQEELNPGGRPKEFRKTVWQLGENGVARGTRHRRMGVTKEWEGGFEPITDLES